MVGGSIIYLVITICSLLVSILLTIIFFVKRKSYEIKNANIKELKNQVEQANKAKNEFLSSLSHEIRTPLNAILGLSEDNMRYENKLPVEVIENMKDIQNASQTLLEIVRNMIDINKIQSGELKMSNTPYNFKQEIGDFCKIILNMVDPRRIQFRVDIADDIPYELIGDKIYVRQIINNLLLNSIRYTESGYINLTVKCINQNDICNLIITIQDTGKGIDKDLINRIEENNMDKKIPNKVKGVGLEIVKFLVKKMNGKINVKSDFGKGTLFIIQIPQKISKMIASDNESINKEVDLGYKQILVVDDNKLNIKVARKALSDYNFDIDECYDGIECLDKINSGQTYDLILMDILMPNMNGEITIRKLQENPNFKTPVIALTADAVAGSREKYLEAGFIDYIAKPFNRRKFKQKIEYVFYTNKK